MPFLICQWSSLPRSVSGFVPFRFQFEIPRFRRVRRAAYSNYTPIRGLQQLHGNPRLAGPLPSAGETVARASNERLMRSLLLGRRFIMQGGGGFILARRGGHEFHSVQGRIALAFADVIEEPLYVVSGFAREVVARLADFSQDGVGSHDCIQTAVSSHTGCIQWFTSVRAVFRAVRRRSPSLLQ